MALRQSIARNATVRTPMRSPLSLTMASVRGWQSAVGASAKAAFKLIKLEPTSWAPRSSSRSTITALRSVALSPDPFESAKGIEQLKAARQLDIETERDSLSSRPEGGPVASSSATKTLPLGATRAARVDASGQICSSPTESTKPSSPVAAAAAAAALVRAKSIGAGGGAGRGRTARNAAASAGAAPSTHSESAPATPPASSSISSVRSTSAGASSSERRQRCAAPTSATSSPLRA
eukprot:scaffold242465_cov33-Tisochrysis_lutea.AAC.2